MLFPLLSPSPFHVFCSLQLSRNNSIGNACYAGYFGLPILDTLLQFFTSKKLEYFIRLEIPQYQYNWE